MFKTKSDLSEGTRKGLALPAQRDLQGYHPHSNFGIIRL
jgi:hypothetical protein